MGCQPDAGRLRAALHSQKCAAVVCRPRRQHCPRRDLVPALEAIGGTITLNYGVTNATAAILVVSVIIFGCGLPIAYHAAKCGIDIDLLTRGAGFGYIGSTITSRSSSFPW